MVIIFMVMLKNIVVLIGVGNVINMINNLIIILKRELYYISNFIIKKHKKYNIVILE